MCQKATFTLFISLNTLLEHKYNVLYVSTVHDALVEGLFVFSVKTTHFISKLNSFFFSKYVWIMNINVSLNNLSPLLFRIDPFVFPVIKVFHRIWKHIFLPPSPLISARHCSWSIASLQRQEVGRFVLTSCAHPFLKKQVSYRAFLAHSDFCVNYSWCRMMLAVHTSHLPVDEALLPFVYLEFILWGIRQAETLLYLEFVILTRQAGNRSISVK